MRVVVGAAGCGVRRGRRRAARAAPAASARRAGDRRRRHAPLRGCSRSLLHFNDADGALKTLTVPVAGTAWLLGGLTLVGGCYLVVTRSSRAAFPIFFTATALFILAFLVWIARGSNVGTVPPLQLTGHPVADLHLGDAAHLRLAVGHHVRALRRRQHRDRGPVHVRRDVQRRSSRASSAATTSASSPAPLVAAVIGGAPRLHPRLHGAALPGEPDHRRRRDRRVLHGDGAVHDVPGPQQRAEPEHRASARCRSPSPGSPRSRSSARSSSTRPTSSTSRSSSSRSSTSCSSGRAGGCACASVGEKPRAAETVGLSVVRIRYAMVILGGMRRGHRRRGLHDRAGHPDGCRDHQAATGSSRSRS